MKERGSLHLEVFKKLMPKTRSELGSPPLTLIQDHIPEQHASLAVRLSPIVLGILLVAYSEPSPEGTVNNASALQLGATFIIAGTISLIGDLLER